MGTGQKLISTSELGSVLGLGISSEKLAEMGFPPDFATGKGKFWRRERVPEIKRALINSLTDSAPAAAVDVLPNFATQMDADIARKFYALATKKPGLIEILDSGYVHSYRKTRWNCSDFFPFAISLYACLYNKNIEDAVKEVTRDSLFVSLISDLVFSVWCDAQDKGESFVRAAFGPIVVGPYVGFMESRGSDVDAYFDEGAV